MSDSPGTSLGTGAKYMQKAHRSQFVFRLPDCQQINVLLMKGLDHTTPLQNDKDVVKISSQEFKRVVRFQKRTAGKNFLPPWVLVCQLF